MKEGTCNCCSAARRTCRSIVVMRRPRLRLDCAVGLAGVVRGEDPLVFGESDLDAAQEGCDIPGVPRSP